nr:hypothetical protein [Tanacetum cinerariifolium]
MEETCSLVMVVGISTTRRLLIQHRSNDGLLLTFLQDATLISYAMIYSSVATRKE